MVLSVLAEIAALFDAERLFFNSSAVKKRTVIPVVGEIFFVLLNKEAIACAHVSNQCSAACCL
jgi:hypothetical protein